MRLSFFLTSFKFKEISNKQHLVSINAILYTMYQTEILIAIGLYINSSICLYITIKQLNIGVTMKYFLTCLAEFTALLMMFGCAYIALVVFS